LSFFRHRATGDPGGGIVRVAQFRNGFRDRYESFGLKTNLGQPRAFIRWAWSQNLKTVAALLCQNRSTIVCLVFFTHQARARINRSGFGKSAIHSVAVLHANRSQNQRIGPSRVSRADNTRYGGDRTLRPAASMSLASPMSSITMCGESRGLRASHRPTGRPRRWGDAFYARLTRKTKMTSGRFNALSGRLSRLKLEDFPMSTYCASSPGVQARANCGQRQAQ